METATSLQRKTLRKAARRKVEDAIRNLAQLNVPVVLTLSDGKELTVKGVRLEAS